MQLAVAWAGLLITLWTLGDAVVDYRLIRRLGVDGAREALTVGELVNELCRILLHLMIIIPSMLILVYRVRYPWTFGSIFFIVMTVIISVMSINSFFARRRVVQAIERRPKKRPS